SIPAAAHPGALYVSEKKPRWSPNRRGVISRTPASSSSLTSTILLRHLCHAPPEISRIFVAAQPIGALQNPLRIEPPHLDANLLRTRDLDALPMLDGPD